MLIRTTMSYLSSVLGYTHAHTHTDTHTQCVLERVRRKGDWCIGLAECKLIFTVENNMKVNIKSELPYDPVAPALSVSTGSGTGS